MEKKPLRCYNDLVECIGLKAAGAVYLASLDDWIHPVDCQ